MAKKTRVALTAEGIKNIKPGKDRKEIADGEQLGLYLLVQPSGFKSFAARFRVDGEPVKFTIGDIYTVTLEEARERTREARAQVRSKVDPRQAKKDAEEAARLARIVEETASIRYLWGEYYKYSEGTKKNGKTRNGKRTMQEKERLWRQELQPRFGEKAATAVTRKDIVDMLDAIVDRNAGTWANRVLSMTNTFFGWMLGRGDVMFVPGHKVPVPTEEENRERILTTKEVRLFWQACLNLGYPFGDMGRMLLLTGTRLREAGEAQREEFKAYDLDGLVWEIPGSRTKNKKDLDLVLPAQAEALLGSLPATSYTDDAGRSHRSPYLFTTTGSTPVSGYSKAKTAIKREMLAIAKREAEEQGHDPEKVVLQDDWRFHDLRRTAATHMGKLGHSPWVVEAVINHSTIIKGVTATYNRYDYKDEKKAALKDWADLLDQIVTGQEDKKVVSFFNANTTAIEAGRKVRKAKAV